VGHEAAGGGAVAVGGCVKISMVSFRLPVPLGLPLGDLLKLAHRGDRIGPEPGTPDHDAVILLDMTAPRRTGEPAVQQKH
jgi:hypothetical protein